VLDLALWTATRGALYLPPLMTGLSLDNIALERGERRIASGISARVAGGEALLLQGRTAAASPRCSGYWRG
jgi:hypothetical protein